MDAAAMKKPIIQSLMESIRETDTEEYLKALVFCFGALTIKGLKVKPNTIVVSAK